MKKFLCVFVFTLLTFLPSCSIPRDYPKEGIWYCEAIRTSIDFSLLLTEEPVARFYDYSGSYVLGDIDLGYGGEIYFYNFSFSKTIPFFCGKFKFSDNEFTVTTTDGTECVFYEIYVGEDGLFGY